MTTTNQTERNGDWMETYSGIHFWPLDPREDEIDIGDIAHALSQLCRFGGHCRSFFSVAEHSLNVASLLPTDLYLAGLLHDATEAYMVDMPRPIKRFMPEYKAAEQRLARVIERKFHLPEYALECDLVKIADDIALVTEARGLLPSRGLTWCTQRQLSNDITIRCYPPQAAEILFMNAFELAPSCK